jgi:hypothetical protein
LKGDADKRNLYPSTGIGAINNSSLKQGVHKQYPNDGQENFGYRFEIMIWNFVDFVKNKKSNQNLRSVFQQIGKSISGSVTHISQIATRAKNRHKRKQRQQGNECPDDFISF